MDKIKIEQLQCYGYHGVYPEENKLGQRYYIDIELGLDLSPAGKYDDLQRSVNYAEICEVVKNAAENKQFKLIEALAEYIATLILETYTIVSETTVRVVKPHPPVNVHMTGASVEIYRKRV